MSMERQIEDWLGELPEPERTEALEARRKAVERDGGSAHNATAYDKADAIRSGFRWLEDGGNPHKWLSIHGRALAGEFDGPSEVDRLRARIAELEVVINDWRIPSHAMGDYRRGYMDAIDEAKEELRSILKKK